MYDTLVLYLKQRNIRLEKYMFRGVLKSLNRRKEGESARSANSWAYQLEVMGYVGDGTANHPGYEKAKKEWVFGLLCGTMADRSVLKQT